ncbi:uncharacterized protein MELLADRAFT_111282 [Melampsora larici-populina 98AG31]|uniref:Uncharacterized protein n=1 Tax=Melampsora larici-populina (strain 98AG31 / pathotype 3-4-7) TaxID=747676 RepID=F4S2M2_MELLP|nr:uncharacterized protein MELLADRAFT_111282 [Melampsora larici-populina 98AG31]EGG01027.1 hypothetical protein MELLADRAFT_111282 [Melampsora larici-populina 98AG31]
MNPNTWRMAETEWKDISGSDLCDRCDEVKNIKNKKVKCGAEIQCACGLGYYCKTPNCRGSYLDYCDKVEHRLVCGVVHPDQPNLHQPPQDPYPSDYMLPMVDSDW